MKINTLAELPFEVDADYQPGRRCPICHDHDNPKFSDSGDDESLEITAVSFRVVIDGKESRVRVPDALLPMVCDLIADDVMSQCRASLEEVPA